MRLAAHSNQIVMQPNCGARAKQVAKAHSCYMLDPQVMYACTATWHTLPSVLRELAGRPMLPNSQLAQNMLASLDKHIFPALRKKRLIHVFTNENDF